MWEGVCMLWWVFSFNSSPLSPSIEVYNSYMLLWCIRIYVFLRAPLFLLLKFTTSFLKLSWILELEMPLIGFFINKRHLDSYHPTTLSLFIHVNTLRHIGRTLWINIGVAFWNLNPCFLHEVRSIHLRWLFMYEIMRTKSPVLSVSYCITAHLNQLSCWVDDHAVSCCVSPEVCWYWNVVRESLACLL